MAGIMFEMRKHALFLIVSFLVTSVIIFSWFSTKTLISNNSEENLSFFSFKRTAEHYSTSWYPTGTGYAYSLGLIRYPFLKFLSLFELAGLPPFFIQAFSYWLIMYLGVVFMYVLLNKGFGLTKLISGAGSFFYLLNLFSMTQVWRRNVYQGMFPWAYLPLFLFLWIKWINDGKLVWLLIFLISTVIFSHAFAHPAYLLTFAIVGGIYSLLKIWQFQKVRSIVLKISFKSVLGLLFAVLVNLWWLYPFIQVSMGANSSLSSAASAEWEANLDSLKGVSKYFNTFDIALLRQSWYFGDHMNWYDFYRNPLVFILSSMIFLITLIGIKVSRKHKFWPFLAILFFVAWFISKGSNFPFGTVFYKWLFNFFPLSAAFRNPYEKFGLVWLLSYSFFFAYGLDWISKRFNKFRYHFLTSVLILGCIVLVYPIWTGDLFPSNTRLSVPPYYQEANNYLNSKSESRIFNLPFTMEMELIKYKWGYLGGDPSENLFDSENISVAKLQIFKDYYELIPKYKENKNLARIFGLAGVDYIILRNETIYPDLTLNHLQTIENLDSIENLKKEKEIGELVIYAVDKELVKPKIYATKLIEVSSLEEGFEKVLSGALDTKNYGFAIDQVLTESPEIIIPKINYIQLANNRYKVKVENAEKPFYLVLNNTFHDLWQAKIDGGILDGHLLVNSFANGWLINKKGTYEIDIIFKVWPWE